MDEETPGATDGVVAARLTGWKRLVYLAVLLLAVVGVIVALANLPIVTGTVPA